MSNLDSFSTPVRSYAKGIGQAVADRTVNRKITRPLDYPEIVQAVLPREDSRALDDVVAAHCKSEGLVQGGYTVTHGDDKEVKVEIVVTARQDIENWADVSKRVAIGNTLLDPRGVGAQQREFHAMHHHLRQASILMSGRHLQHGDESQPTRNQEVFTNCSTAAASFLSYYLLLNGSGVGRAYDNTMMKVNWRNLPVVVPVLDMGHPDSWEIDILDRRNAEHLYADSKIHVFEVEDSREGWAKAVEKMELMAFQAKYREDVLLLDFSKVRAKGQPIKGMQNRPASGPGPMIKAVQKVAKLRETQMEPWRQAMYVDHYLAECVLVGGARRAARMATKTWRDENVFGFIEVKRGGFLWSSNNSVTVDDDFWRYVVMDSKDVETLNSVEYKLAKHAKAVLEAIAYASYHDGTGEPGLINQAKLTQNNAQIDMYKDGKFAGSKRYKLEPETLELTKALVSAFLGSQYHMITNPCGEITLIMLGGYCVIADVVPYHAQDLDDAEDAFRVATRSLIRVNTMDCLYRREVNRTNRIGVGMTGLHEFAWKFFGLGWKEMVDEERSKDFWLTLSRFKRAVKDEATRYAAEIGVSVPHTDTTMKPAGTTSKLFALSEGAHLPAMLEYLRWVQFRNDDPLVKDYEAKGYPVKRLRSYSGTTVVGFPTQPEICTLGMGERLVTAAEATPEEQYQYLRLLEKYWITGVAEDGETPLSGSGNQVSYTLKYNPSIVDYASFKRTLIEGQSTIRCCSVMPQVDTTSYEYQPEEPVEKAEFERIVRALAAQEEVKEDIGFEHVDCGTGACPINFGEKVS